MYKHFPLHGDILAARHFLYYSLILPPTKLKKRVENWGRKEVKNNIPLKNLQITETSRLHNCHE